MYRESFPSHHASQLLLKEDWSAAEGRTYATLLGQVLLVVSADSLLDVFVDVLSMANGENADFCRHHFEDDAIVADAKFPVPLQCFPERGSKLLRVLSQTGFDCIGDAASEVAWN